MTVVATYSIRDLRAAVSARKLGTYDALPGWTYRGRAIARVEFDRAEIVRFFDPAGVCFATFQDRAGLDD